MARHSRRLFAFVAAVLALAITLLSVSCSQQAPAPTQAPAAPAPTAAPKVSDPTQPVSVIVPFAAGGGLDIGARIMATYLEKELGQPFQIVNEAGASGQIGWTKFAASKPDGYTLTTLSSPNTESTYLDPKRQSAYKRTTFAAISNQVYDPNTYSVLSSSPYKNLNDLIQAVKAKPESIITGDGGLMTDDHLSILTLQKKMGVKFAMTHFDGGGPAQTALHGGHVQVLVGNIGDAMSGYKNGQFRVLGIASEQRSPLLPDVPTLKEQGIDVVTAVARGWAAPEGTPKEIIKVLETAMKKIGGMPEYQDKMSTAGLPTHFMTSEDYDKYLQAEETRVAQLIKELN